MNQKERIIFLIYFVTGMTINCITVGLPLFFATAGYEKVQVGILTSVLFLGSIAQPLIGYICDVSGKKQLVAQGLFLGISIVTVSMTIFRSFYMMVFLSFLISVFKDPIIGLLDDIVIKYINTVGGNYGKLRSGASWGYALGLFFILPFNYLLRNIEELVPALTLTFILGIVYIFLQRLLGDISYAGNLEKDISMLKENNHLYKKEVKKKLLNQTYILFVLINLLIMGTSTAKSSYQSIFLQDFGATALMLSIANFVTIIPEMFLMANMRRWLKGISLRKILYGVVTISIIFNTLIAFAPSGVFLVSILWLHGLMMSMYIPSFYIVLRGYLGENVSASGFLISAMSQNLGSFLIGYFIITPIYSNFGFTMLFLSATLLNFLAIIPITMLNEKKYAK